MTEKNNISGVEAIRQLIEAQKNWHVFRAKKENDKNTIYVGDTSLTEEELSSIKAGGPIPSEGLTYEIPEGENYAICTGLEEGRTETDIVIASIYQGVPVTSIGSEAFWGCESLTSVTITNNVTSIGDHAFTGCYSLKSITIPDSVTSIGMTAFAACSNLKDIIIPDGVASINDQTFTGCASLTSITIPNSVTSIGYQAFGGCHSLTSIVIPRNVTSIGSWAFSNGLSLTSVVIPDSVTHIDSDAFYNCDSLTIYCEATEEPSDWSGSWNPDNRPVVWGYALDIPAINDRIVSVENNIGDIEAALDTILAIQKELLPKSIITFYIINHYAGGITQTHTALEGMTWFEWCNSEYNTIGMYCNHEKGNVYAPDGIGVLQEQGVSNIMFGDKIIVAEQTYRLS